MSQHLQEYLQYYRTIENPGYAVLVTGDWGTGKTFQVKQYIPEEERHYVSLFGLQTPEEIHSSIIAQMLPNRAKLSSALNKAQATSKDIGGLWSLAQLPAGLANNFIKMEIKSDKVIVLDDLERCGLDLKDTLGIINEYVEQHECKVVVIAHDNKLVKGFKRQKEKVFGQSIKVEPDIPSAFKAFVKNLSNSDQIQFVKKYDQQILRIFEESGSQSLRVLRHTVEDIGRIYRIIDEKFFRSEEALLELIRVFTAFDIEIRTGGLSDIDLQNREHASLLSHMKSENKSDQKRAFVKANEKYGLVDLETNLLTDDVLYEFFIQGLFDAEKLTTALDNSHYFMDPAEERPWKIVINFDTLEDSIVDEALANLKKDFTSRAVVEPGELLQIFSLLLMLSDEGIDQRGIDETASECRKYIDDLYSDGRLPEWQIDWGLNSDVYERAYQNYGFWVTKNTEKLFQDIREYLYCLMKQRLSQRYSEIAAELIELMDLESEKFSEMICFGGGGNGKYALVPIFAAIEPSKFVEKLLTIQRSSLRIVAHSLTMRYEANRLKNELSDEEKWIIEVAGELEKQIAAEGGLKALRLKRVVDHHLVPIVRDLDSRFNTSRISDPAD